MAASALLRRNFGFAAAATVTIIALICFASPRAARCRRVVQGDSLSRFAFRQRRLRECRRRLGSISGSGSYFGFAFCFGFRPSVGFCFCCRYFVAIRQMPLLGRSDTMPSIVVFACRSWRLRSFCCHCVRAGSRGRSIAFRSKSRAEHRALLSRVVRKLYYSCRRGGRGGGGGGHRRGLSRRRAG